MPSLLGRVRCALDIQRAWGAQLAGRPRRARALLRRASRHASPTQLCEMTLCEANALLWEGSFERAIALLHARAASGPVATVIELECLLFDGRVEEARERFALHEHELRRSRRVRFDLIAIQGILAFHGDDLESARRHLDKLTLLPSGDPVVWGALFFLAAIAHRRGDRDEAGRCLGIAAVHGGRTFVARWAAHQLADLFPGVRLPDRRRPPARVARLRRFAIAIGFAVACVTMLVPVAVMLARSPRTAAPRVEASPRRLERTVRLEENANRNELAFVQAERLHSTLREVLPGRPGFTDLYFVGGAGWAEQDVFFREVSSARSLLDEQFDTAGRSVVLANDPAARDTNPLLANVTLRRALAVVGDRMDRDEDVLFLLLSSHGSTDGLALGFSANAAFAEEVLRPSDLRSMLDDARIKWRVLLVAGCETGVFIDALKDEHTLVATAAASDRPSYGCATGNPFTEFGRAVFAEQLQQERSFIRAFANAARSVSEKEAEQKVLASRPQIHEGSAIAAKLRDLEARVARR